MAVSSVPGTRPTRGDRMSRAPGDETQHRSADTLALDLLGPPRIRVGQPIELPTRKALALVAYLAVHGPVSRPRAGALLWSDRDDVDARRNLRQELHRIHATALGDWIETRGDELALRPGADIDVDRLRRAAADHRDADVLAIHRGPLLADVDLKGAAGFAEWLAAERDEVARLWRASLAREAAARERDGDIAGALDLARALLDDDPLDEARHRTLMRLLYRAGDRRAASRSSSAAATCSRANSVSLPATRRSRGLVASRRPRQRPCRPTPTTRRRRSRRRWWVATLPGPRSPRFDEVLHW